MCVCVCAWGVVKCVKVTFWLIGDSGCWLAQSNIKLLPQLIGADILDDTNCVSSRMPVLQRGNIQACATLEMYCMNS